MYDRVVIPDAKVFDVGQVLSRFRDILSVGGKSRIGVMPGGATVPVLTLLAQTKYGQYDPSVFTPVWRDGDLLNETWENVGLAFVRARTEKKSGVEAPSGTREYHREYKQRRRERAAAAPVLTEQEITSDARLNSLMSTLAEAIEEPKV